MDQQQPRVLDLSPSAVRTAGEISSELERLTQLVATVEHALAECNVKNVQMQEAEDFESQQITRLTDELNSTKQHCNQIKRDMKQASMHRIASLNDAIDRERRRVEELHLQNESLTVKQSETFEKIALLEEQLVFIDEEEARSFRLKRLELADKAKRNVVVVARSPGSPKESRESGSLTSPTNSPSRPQMLQDRLQQSLRSICTMRKTAQAMMKVDEEQETGAGGSPSSAPIISAKHTGQTLLTHNRVVELLTSLPSDDDPRLDAFFTEGESVAETNNRQLRKLGDFFEKQLIAAAVDPSNAATPPPRLQSLHGAANAQKRLTDLSSSVPKRCQSTPLLPPLNNYALSSSSSSHAEDDLFLHNENHQRIMEKSKRRIAQHHDP